MKRGVQPTSSANSCTLDTPPRAAMFVKSFQKQLVFFVSPFLPLFCDRVGLANLRRNAATRSTFTALCQLPFEYQCTNHLGRVLDLRPCHVRIGPAALRTKHCCCHSKTKICREGISYVRPRALAPSTNPAGLQLDQAVSTDTPEDPDTAPA